MKPIVQPPIRAFAPSEKVSCFLFFLCSILFLISPAQAQVSGSVFKDFNANGKRTSGTDTLEVGVPNVKVQLFVGSNDTPLEKTTNSKGYYAFSSTEAPKDSSFRLEFVDLPAFYIDSPVSANSSSSVLFGTVPQANFDFGISSDEDFCFDINDVRMITSCFANGDALGGGSAGEEPAVVMLKYTDQGLAERDFPLTKLAKVKDVGAVWPATYHKMGRRVIIAPIVRRHSGLGVLGTSGLYSVSENGTTDTLVNFKKRYGIDFGDDPHVGLNANMLVANHDSATMHHVGKRAFGGLEFSRYQDSLLFINLFDKKLYIAKLDQNGNMPANKSDIVAISIPNPGCSNGDYRPWALKYYRGMYYVGVVCSGETSQNKDDLKFTIYKFNPVSQQFTNLITEPLTYKRDPLDVTGPYCFTYDRWLPWTAEWPRVCNKETSEPGSGTNFVMYPQPILSDIEFDVDGTMVLGFMDRFGLQAGQDNFGPSAADQRKYTGFMSGDLLRVHLENGVYKLEQNGKSGDLIGCGANKGAGPGGGEFYCEDEWTFLGKIAHSETTNGGVALIPGTGEVIATAMDPVDELFASSGYRVFSNKTGKYRRGLALYSSKPGTLGKSGGVSDVVLLCDPPSIEVGNRIWFDRNRNGVQEPNEAGLDGIVVQLYDPDSSKVVSTDTTKRGGQFYFGRKNVPGKLKPRHRYEIKVDMTQPGSANPYPGLPTVSANNLRTLRTAAPDSLLAQYDLSPLNANTFNNPTIRDSDASYVNGKKGLSIVFDTQNLGINDFTQDIGLTQKRIAEPKFDLELNKKIIGECVKQINDTVTFRIVLKNVGERLSIADSVFVADTLTTNLTFISAIATQGTYSNTTHLWGALKLVAGDSATLTIKAKINNANKFEGGSIINVAEVKSHKGADIDSRPGNGIRTEDDFSLALATVPMKICPAKNDTLIISAPGIYTKYQWFRNGVKIEGATKATLEVGAPGQYNVEVENNGCVSKNCCPMVVLEECLCPTQICVPFVISKTKSKGILIPRTR